jgi:hypothetical protein
MALVEPRFPISTRSELTLVPLLVSTPMIYQAVEKPYDLDAKWDSLVF